MWNRFHAILLLCLVLARGNRLQDDDGPEDEPGEDEFGDQNSGVEGDAEQLAVPVTTLGEAVSQAVEASAALPPEATSAGKDAGGRSQPVLVKIRPLEGLKGAAGQTRWLAKDSAIPVALVFDRQKRRFYVNFAGWEMGPFDVRPAMHAGRQLDFFHLVLDGKMVLQADDDKMPTTLLQRVVPDFVKRYSSSTTGMPESWAFKIDVRPNEDDPCLIFFFYPKGTGAHTGWSKVVHLNHVAESEDASEDMQM